MIYSAPLWLAITYGYCAMLLIISFVGMYCYQQLSAAFRVLAWSVIMTFIIAVASKIANAKYHNNYPVIHIEGITEYVFYSLVYYYLFKSKAIQKVIMISIPVMTGFFFFNAVFLQPFFTVFPTNLNIPAQILYAAFSLLLFREMLNYPLKVNIVQQGAFWFNTAMLFFALTMFFNLGISNYLTLKPDDPLITALWYLILYIFHIFICTALITDNKENGTTDVQQ